MSRLGMFPKKGGYGVCGTRPYEGEATAKSKSRRDAGATKSGRIDLNDYFWLRR